MPQHHPGPYAIAGQRHLVADPSRDGRMIASIDPYEFTPEMRAANLRLLGASPRLYAALVALLREADSVTIANGGTPGVSDRWEAAKDARSALALVEEPRA